MKLFKLLSKIVAPIFLTTSLVVNPYSGCKINNLPSFEPYKNEIPETTKPLEDIISDNLISYNDGVLIFNEVAELENFNVGDILIDDMSEVAPNGLIRKILNISEGNKTIYTESVSLEEAIKNCNVVFNNDLAAKNLRFVDLEKGVALGVATHDYNFAINLENFVLYDNDKDLETTDDQIIANGNFNFNLSFKGDIKIKDFKLEKFSLENIINENFNLKLSNESEFFVKNLNIKLAEYKFSPFVAVVIPSVPPVPIVVVPELEAYLNFDGSADSKISVGISQNSELKIGFNYEYGLFVPIDEFSNNFDFENLTFSSDVEVKAALGAKLNLLFYGISGPYGDINGYLRAIANVDRNPKWSLYGGLEAKIGIDMSILGSSAPNFSKTLFNTEKILIEEKIIDELEERIFFLSTRDGNSEIYTMNSDGTNQKRLTNTLKNENYLSLSPDGKKLAFSLQGDNGYGIYTMNSDGTNRTMLLDDSIYNKYPSWSPDGKKIVFDSRIGTYGPNIEIIDFDGLNKKMLTNSYNADKYPSWSPDGSKIIYSSSDGVHYLYTMNIDGTNKLKVTTNTGYGGEYYPSWSPDGSKILFTSGRYYNTQDIYIMNSDSSNKIKLTNESFYDFYHSWSPDGKKIIYSSFDDGNREIYTMNIDGTNKNRLTNNSYRDTSPVWGIIDN